jgi:hypothetical protein
VYDPSLLDPGHLLDANIGVKLWVTSTERNRAVPDMVEQVVS